MSHEAFFMEAARVVAKDGSQLDEIEKEWVGHQLHLKRLKEDLQARLPEWTFFLYSGQLAPSDQRGLSDSLRAVRNDVNAPGVVCMFEFSSRVGSSYSHQVDTLIRMLLNNLVQQLCTAPKKD